MPTDISLISVRCLGHGGNMLLSEAILEGWRMCNECHLFLCPTCAKAFETEQGGACPGSHGRREHKMALVGIPTDEVILFVRHAIEAPRLGPLVYEVFFSERGPQLDPFGGVRPEPERRSPPDDPLAILRREDWKRYGVVMVKRKRGRYVTWGPVG